MTAGRSTSGTPRHHRIAAAALAAMVAWCGFTLTACHSEAREEPDRRASAPPSGDDSSAPVPGASPAWDSAPDSLAAVGDSLTTAFDACDPLAECPRASWATGTSPSVDSLARRLLDQPERNSWNLAETGATVSDLPAQMTRAAAHEPELVTVLVGANDACRPSVDAMTPVADFRARFTEALRALWEESPQAQVYVASIPDLERLWEIGRGTPEARQAWRWGICPSLLHAPQADDAAAKDRRAQVSDRVRAYNSVLADVCAAERRCRWDGGAVHDYRFTAGALSTWDWFHPSRKGQRALAALAHARITAR